MNFERGKTPVEALELGMEQVLENFLEKVDQKTSKLEHKLHTSVIYGQADLVEYLLQKGATLKLEHLRIAINQERINLVKLILETNPGFKDILTITSYRWSKMDPIIKDLLYPEFR